MSERLSNIRLLARCALYFVSHGSAKRVVQQPKLVVIVQFGKLGDMVCTTPMFRAIKKASPSTRVIVIGDKVGGEVLAGNTDVDRYIVCGTDTGPALHELRAEQPEVGISVGPSLRAVALLYLSGVRLLVAPKVVGAISSESRLYKLMRRVGILAPHTIGQYAPREYLRLLEPLGIVSDDTHKRVAFTEDARAYIERFLQPQSGTLVGIAASAGNKIKDWSAERFAAVSDYVSSKYGATVVIVGGPADRTASEAIVRRLSPATTFVDTTGVFTVDELKALVARLTIFIGVDTGPIYIAEALGVPTIDIVGPMDEHEQPPTGERHLVVVPPFARKPQLFIMSPGTYDYVEARRQAESITVSQVTDAVDTLLARISQTDSAQL